MKLQLTITNPRVEAWLNKRVKATGNTMQVVLRDLAFNAMRADVEVVDNDDDDECDTDGILGVPLKWGETPAHLSKKKGAK